MLLKSKPGLIGRPRTFRDSSEAVHHPGRTGAQKLRAQHDWRRRPGRRWRSRHRCPEGIPVPKR